MNHLGSHSEWFDGIVVEEVQFFYNIHFCSAT